MSSIVKNYETAREMYGELGVDTDEVLRILSFKPISMHCWQLDDLTGFENFEAELTGGIQATGNYPGKPQSVDEYIRDLNKTLSLVPGAVKLALHSVYPVSEKKVPRNQLEREQFEFWVDYAKDKRIGLDFNPTYFSHPMSESNFTLSSSDAGIREFWIQHGIACRKIGEYFGRELGQTCVTNHWIPDGSKDLRVDKLGPRERLTESLDRIFAEKIDPKYNLDSLESKLFGLGLESYTVGSHEFYTNYVMNRDNCLICMDAGHFHPTETISDKVSSFICFGKEIMLHVSRPVRWDSDHVVLFDDECRAIMQEIVRCNAIEKVHIGLDYFDASIHRIAASVLGVRNAKKALLYALLEPAELKRAEQEFNYTKRLTLLEEMKTMPFGFVWDMFCEMHNVPGGRWLETVMD